MAYWMLVLSGSAECPALDAVEVPLFSDFNADYAIRHGTELDWREIELSFVGRPSDDDGDDLVGGGLDREQEGFATVFRDPIDRAPLRDLPGWTGWRSYIEDLCSKLDDVAPRANARWLQAFLREVRTIYHFTPHHAERSEEAMQALRAVMWSLQQEARPAIAYADGEGYYDQDGSLVTWEFDSDDRHGTRVVAILSDSGWRTFSIDLATTEQREAFKAGRLPATLG